MNNKLNLGDDLYIKGRIGWRGLSKDEYLKESDYRIINATALEDGYVDWDNCGFISKERYDESEEIMLKEGDILISKDGTLGKIGYVKNLKGKCTVASGVFVVRNTVPEKLNFDYLYHVLKSNVFKDFIRRNKANGSTINHLYQRDLEKFEIDLPSLDIQNKIANFLNLIDEKISNNRKIVKKVNNITKTIYEQWFLKYNIPNFNMELVWSDDINKKIPNDWRVLTVKDCIEHINTGLNPRQNFVFGDGNIKYVTVKNLTTEGTIDFSGCDVISNKVKEIVNKRSQLSKNDILFASIAPLGRCVIVEEEPLDWDINESVFAIRVKDNIVNPEYLYEYFMSDLFIKTAEHKSTGSIFSGLRITALENMKVVIPDKKALELFSKTVNPLFKLKYNCEKDSQKLNEYNKYFIPALLSGQIEFEKK